MALKLLQGDCGHILVRPSRIEADRFRNLYLGKKAYRRVEGCNTLQDMYIFVGLFEHRLEAFLIIKEIEYHLWRI